MSYSIIYQSKAQETLKITEIDNMLLKAKRSNKKNNVTGCIVYHDNQFIQIIEGEKSTITALYAKIKDDKRHFNVMTLTETSTKQTLWDSWSMAFYKFTGDVIRDQHNRILLETYFESANQEANTSGVLKILKQSVRELMNSKK